MDAEARPLLGRLKRPQGMKDTILSKSKDSRKKTIDAAVSKREDGKAGRFLLNSVILWFWPCAAFMYMSTIIFFVYYDSTYTTTALFIIPTLMLHAMNGTEFFAAKKWQRATIRHSMIGLIAGLAVGSLIYYQKLIFYYGYQRHRTYSNVAASQQSLQFVDAGKLEFTVDSKVDTTRAVGFRSAMDHHTLCVAPIVDGSMGQSDPVSFFAIGEGCCGWRANFRCGDVGDPSARSGLMMMDSSLLAGPVMAWTVARVTDRDHYDKAIALQKAAFGTTIADDTRLVWWTKDPDKLRDDRYLWSSWNDLGNAFMVFATIAGLGSWLVMSSDGQKGSTGDVLGDAENAFAAGKIPGQM